MFTLHSKLPQVSTSIFTVMSKLAADTGAINLSQGYPDFDCSPHLVDLVTKNMQSGNNQYAPMQGLFALRQRIADKTNELYGGRYNPDTDITITAGGTQAIYTALAAVIQPGDEVIIFEPAYDSYGPAIKIHGGLVKIFELAPLDYRIDWSMVRKLITSRTRMLILNSPQNPSGTILNEEDIKQLINITTNTDILILSDEVYEHLVYDDGKHLSMARFDELRERSFIIASFGKLFHTTGWKIGYCMAPPRLMKEFRKVHQFLVFSVNAPMQFAIAEYMADKETYMQLPAFFQQKRDFFSALMKSTRFDLLPCKGSYFQSASYAKISDEKDTDFAKRLTTEFGVACIPISAFYTRANDHRIVRFCFAKKQETLEMAVERLTKVFK